MPSALERAARAWRRRLLAQEREPLAQMRRIYEQSWERLQGEIEAYTARIEAEDPLLPGLLHRRAAARDAQRVIEAEIERLTRAAEAGTVSLQRGAVDAAHASVREMVAAQDAQAAAFLRRPDVRAVEALVGFASDGSPLRELFEEATAGQAEAMVELLARNVALGIHPRVTARQMEEQFGVSLTRAQTIARTEALRAYRSVSLQTMRANADVIEGWTRYEACDRRTCPPCWALHGRFYRLDEEPQEHPNGRMVLIPKVKGRDRAIQMGEERFAGLSAAEQRGILGPAAYEAYRDGTLRLGDLVGYRRNERWGTSVYTRSLRSVAGAERAAGYNTRGRIRSGILAESGASATRKGLAQIDRLVETRSMTPGAVQELLVAMRSQVDLPALGRHFEAHGQLFEALGVFDVDGFEAAYQQHLKRDDLRVFTYVTTKGTQDRMWVLVGMDNGVTALYNESRRTMWSFYRHEVTDLYLRSGHGWWVELIEDESGVRFLPWKAQTSP